MGYKSSTSTFHMNEDTGEFTAWNNAGRANEKSTCSVVVGVVQSTEECLVVPQLLLE
jgi:hypothetical protein